MRLAVSEISNYPLTVFSKLGFSWAFLDFYYYSIIHSYYNTKMGKFINGLTPYEIIIIFTYKLFLIEFYHLMVMLKLLSPKFLMI